MRSCLSIAGPILILYAGPDGFHVILNKTITKLLDTHPSQMNSHNNDNILNKYLIMFNQQTKLNESHTKHTALWSVHTSTKTIKKKKKKNMLICFAWSVCPVGVWQCELAFRCFGKQQKTVKK